MGIILIKKKDMKFAALAATLAAVSAEACDPNMMWFEFYDDADCMYWNDKMNQDFSRPLKEQHYMYSGDCEAFPNKVDNSVVMDCNQFGFNEWVYKGRHCETAWEVNGDQGNLIDYQWNTCTSLLGMDKYVVVRTFQTFDDKYMPMFLF